KPICEMLIIVSITALIAFVHSQGCAQRQLSTGIVCVCNATYCDSIEPLGQIADNEAVIYLTNIDGARLERTVLAKSSVLTGFLLTLDPNTQYQELLGFGGSFTDSTGINLLALSEAAREHLIQSYFGVNGSAYTLGRIPIASTDFSPRPYSYAEVKDDFQMEHFSLMEEDYSYKLPFIKRAADLQKANGGLKLVAAPWSAPAWMKSNGIMNGGGKLRGFEGGPYYDAWAKYFVKFFEAYSTEGVDFWAAEVQNEPRCGADPKYKWQSMYFSPESEANFVVNQLSPALKNSSVSKDIKIIGMTDQRGELPDWPRKMFADPAARTLIDGISVHWYEDDFKSAELLTTTHSDFPEKFILASEASNGFMDPHNIRMRPGDYGRAEKYAHSIIEDLNHFVSGWIDWNLALDMTGGPTWVDNVLDATILVNATVDEFYKQPSYYALAHFSKFLKPGSRRVLLEINGGIGKHVDAFGGIGADGKRVVVVVNTDKQEALRLSVADKTRDGVANIELGPRSMMTIIWN
ncbi:hypothetical protein PENTCL1PPCAC_19956, partial [Pristionchus entomophagus]